MIGKIVKASYSKDEYLIKTDLHNIKITGDVQSFFLDRIVDITEHKGFYPPDGRIISCITVDGKVIRRDYHRTFNNAHTITLMFDDFTLAELDCFGKIRIDVRRLTYEKKNANPSNPHEQGWK